MNLVVNAAHPHRANTLLMMSRSSAPPAPRKSARPKRAPYTVTKPSVSLANAPLVVVAMAGTLVAMCGFWLFAWAMSAVFAMPVQPAVRAESAPLLVPRPARAVRRIASEGSTVWLARNVDELPADANAPTSVPWVP